MRQEMYVYGAQTTAYGIFCALEARGESVIGYVVTRREGNPASIREKRVFCLEDLDPADHPKFYLAVPEYLHPEIIEILEGRGFHDYVPVDGGMEYHLMKDYYRAMGRLRFLEDCETKTSKEEAEGDVEIYVAVSAGDRPLLGTPVFPEGAVTVQAGAAVSPPVTATFRDDTGKNISWKNCHYDELTVTYWAWKNCRAKVKGIAHYRRCLAITPEERKGLLTGSIDLILPLPFLCWPDTSMQFERYNTSEAVSAMWEAIERVHGICMRKKAEEILREDLLYNYNMLVARAPVFDDYCAWIFPVLEEVERLHPELFPSKVHTRVCGHLGELLGTIYFRTYGDPLRIVHGRKVWFV